MCFSGARGLEGYESGEWEVRLIWLIPPTLQFLLEALSCPLSRVNEYKQFEINTLVLVSSKETHCWFYRRLILCAQ